MATRIVRVTTRTDSREPRAAAGPADGRVHARVEPTADGFYRVSDAANGWLNEEYRRDGEGCDLHARFSDAVVEAAGRAAEIGSWDDEGWRARKVTPLEAPGDGEPAQTTEFETWTDGHVEHVRNLASGEETTYEENGARRRVANSQLAVGTAVRHAVEREMAQRDAAGGPAPPRAAGGPARWECELSAAVKRSAPGKDEFDHAARVDVTTPDGEVLAYGGTHESSWNGRADSAWNSERCDADGTAAVMRAAAQRALSGEPPPRRTKRDTSRLSDVTTIRMTVRAERDAAGRGTITARAGGRTVATAVQNAGDACWTVRNEHGAPGAGTRREVEFVKAVGKTAYEGALTLAREHLPNRAPERRALPAPERPPAQAAARTAGIDRTPLTASR